MGTVSTNRKAHVSPKAQMKKPIYHKIITYIITTSKFIEFSGMSGQNELFSADSVTCVLEKQIDLVSKQKNVSFLAAALFTHYSSSYHGQCRIGQKNKYGLIIL